MCMQCVAQSTPMVAVGFTVLRRRALYAFIKAPFARLPGLGDRPLLGLRAAPEGEDRDIEQRRRLLRIHDGRGADTEG
jgi:hypothetical protein